MGENVTQISEKIEKAIEELQIRIIYIFIRLIFFILYGVDI